MTVRRLSTRSVSFAFALAAFVGCAATPSAPATSSASAPAKAHGIDRAGMDRAVLPGNDFYAYANGSWMKSVEIPADRPGVWADTALVNEVDARTRDLLETAAKAQATAGTSAQRLGDYYASYVDEAGIEAKGIAPLQPQLAKIDAIATRTDLAAALGDRLRADVDPLNAGDFETEHLFGVWVAPDFQDPSRYAPYLLQGGLNLPDRDYYLSPAPEMNEIRAKYAAHLVTVLKLAGLSDPEGRAARTVALERKIAELQATRVDSEDVHKGNNPWLMTEFQTRAPGLDWAAYFGAAGLKGQGHFIVWQPAAVTGLAALVGHEPIATWKDYLAVHALEHAARFLPAAFESEHFAFYDKLLRGTPLPRERWKRGIDRTNEALGDAVGQVYVKRYFPPEAKAKAQGIVANVVSAFGRRIDALDWMAPTTKAKAKEKLSTLIVGLGYPEHWRDDDGLQIVRGDALGNLERAERFEYAGRVKKLGTAVDRGAWSMEPQVVNAVNMPLQNALAFPAAILQPPFFDPQASDAINYGAIGAVIGHEISHSFDDQGCLFDASGRLVNWWTPEDMAHFEAAATRLVAQYNAYHPLPGLSINGKLTLSENIADVAGLSAAYDASKAANPSAPPGADGLTSDQDFFVSFAQTWREKTRDAALRERLLSDGHSPAPFRSLTVRNLDGWYSAFDVQPGQALYLAPADRVRVW